MPNKKRIKKRIFCRLPLVSQNQEVQFPIEHEHLQEH